MIEKEANELPKNIKSVPETMRIHQAIVSDPRIVRTRVLSCFCKKPIDCDCFGTILIYFKQNEPLINHVQHDAEVTVPDQGQDLQCNVQPTSSLRIPEVIDESLLSQYCVVTYDKVLYPGLIMDVDDTEVKVKIMHKKGHNRFFWPMVDDILWYSKDKIITLLNEHPRLVTKRHHEIPHNVWKDVEETIED